MENSQKEVTKPGYFYVLWCKDNSFYAGYTTDLERREAEHNAGTAAKYTRPITRRPLQMIYAEKFPAKNLAMRAEYAFKQLTRAQKEKYLKDNCVVFPLNRKAECIVKDMVTENENPTKL